MKLTDILFIYLIINSGLVFADEKVESEGGPFIIKVMPKIIGAGFTLGYTGFTFIDGRDTIIWFGTGASWIKTPFYRNADDELLTSDNAEEINIDEDLSFYNLNFNGNYGITQGILWNRQTNANLLDISLFCRGRYDYHFEDDERDQILFNQNEDLPDMESIQQTSFITGFSLNHIIKDKADHLIKGIYSEISLEWGPSFINQTADFLRLNFAFKGFVPLFNLKTKTSHNFNMYFCNYFVVDWITGDTIPINIRQSIGGLRNQRFALGGRTIRAIDFGRYDSNLKIANCIDLRINLPFIIPPDIVPGFIVYFDSGYYDLLEGADDGFLFSTGLGIFFNMFNKFQLTGYTGFYLNGENVNGEKWKPFSFAFKFHF